MQYMPCSFIITIEMLSENHIVEMCDFLKPIIHSSVTHFCVVYNMNETKWPKAKKTALPSSKR